MEETLIETLVKATGCPRERVLEQLGNWLLKAGKNPKNPSLEDLREALIPILQELFTDVAAGKNSYIKLNKSKEESP